MKQDSLDIFRADIAGAKRLFRETSDTSVRIFDPTIGFVEAYDAKLIEDAIHKFATREAFLK